MKETVAAMTALIKNEVCGAELDAGSCRFDEKALLALYQLSKNHDLAHLVADALKRHDLLPEGEIKAKFEKKMMAAVYRYECIRYELQRLCDLLHEAEIPFLPLKGSVMRGYYPEPWMRTSCDIDILVEKKDLEHAVALLTGRLGYRAESGQSHDIGLFSPSGVHLELHFSLIESNIVGKADEVLKAAWAESAPISDGSYRYVMSEEMFYYYHVAHMAKHFQHGGCGVRPFLDLWMLNRKVKYDEKKRRAFLEAGGLEKFEDAARQLSEVWFGNGTRNAVVEEMEQFVICGGVYGTMDNRVAVQQIRKGGKLRYALSRIWLPYNTLKFHYPSLDGKRILLPLYEVRRWGKLLFCGGAKRGVRELKRNSEQTKEEQLQTVEMLSHLGLDR